MCLSIREVQVQTVHEQELHESDCDLVARASLLTATQLPVPCPLSQCTANHLLLPGPKAWTAPWRAPHNSSAVSLELTALPWFSLSDY